jgi:hypothetical protein
MPFKPLSRPNTTNRRMEGDVLMDSFSNVARINPNISLGGSDPATGSEDGYLSRLVYVNASSVAVGASFAGEICQAAPSSWTTVADIPDGNWFEIDIRAGGGGGGGGISYSNVAGHAGGAGGGGGARHPPIFLTRAELVTMLPITIAAGLGGNGGIGMVRVSGVVTTPVSAGGTGNISRFGEFIAYGGGGGSEGTASLARHGGTGGGISGPGLGPTGSTAPRVGGSPAFTPGRNGLDADGAGTNDISTGTQTSSNAAVWGGASGAHPTQGSLITANPGGCSIFGGCGGGGGGISPNNADASGGGDGGAPPTAADQLRGGGGSGGAPSTSTAAPIASAGSGGANGNKLVSGAGGGGGGGAGSSSGNANFTGGAGGAGGFPSGGGGGGGPARLIITDKIGGTGGTGADGVVIITAYQK